MRVVSSDVAADVKAAREEIGRCAETRTRFNLRAFLRQRGCNRPDSVMRSFANTYGMTTMAMCAALRDGKDVPDPKRSTAVGRAEALRAHIDECIAAGKPVKRGTVGDFIKGTGARCDNSVRTAFARIYLSSPKDYYLDKLVERARNIRAAQPRIARGFLAARLGVDDAMVDKVLARLVTEEKAA